MTQKEQELLLKDLCARLPYGVKCHVPISDKVMTLTGKRLNYYCFHDEKWGFDYSHELEVVLDPLNDAHNGYIIKPYLRPMSSMTEEECVEFKWLNDKCDAMPTFEYVPVENYRIFDWLNRHHFDFRNLIEKGLAIAVTKENNPYKE